MRAVLQVWCLCVGAEDLLVVMVLVVYSEHELGRGLDVKVSQSVRPDSKQVELWAEQLRSQVTL